MNKLSVTSFNSRIASSIYEPRNPRNSTSFYKTKDFVLKASDRTEPRLNPNLTAPTDFVQYNPYSQSLWYYCRGDEWAKDAKDSTELKTKPNLTDIQRSASINSTHYKNPETVSKLVDNLLINEQKYCVSLKLNDFLMETFIEFLQENSIQMRIKDIFKLFGNSKIIFQISDLFIDKLTLFKQNNFKSFDHQDGNIEKILLSYLQRKLHTYPIELLIHKDKIEFYSRYIKQNSLFEEWLDFANNKIVANTDYKDFNQFLNIYLFELENIRDILKIENLDNTWNECFNIIEKLISKVGKPKDINKVEFYQPIKYNSYPTLSQNLNSFQLNNHILNITKIKLNELQKIQKYMIQSIRQLKIYCNNNIKLSNLLILMKTSFQEEEIKGHKKSGDNNNTRKRASYESINLNTPISLKFRNSFVNSSYELYQEKASLQLDKSAQIFQNFQTTQMKVQSIKEAALQLISSVKSHQRHHEIQSENSIIKFYNCTDNNWKLSQCLLYLDQSLNILVKKYIKSLNEFYKIISYSGKISNYAEIIQTFYDSRRANKKLSIESNEGTFEENLGLTKVVKKLYR